MATYASLADLKEWLGITTSTNDALLTRLLDAATSFMNSYMNRDGLASAAKTETRDGNGNKRLMLKHWPASSVSTVTVNGTSIPASTSWDMAGYVLSANSIVLRGSVFEEGVQNVYLAYTAGYPTTPEDIRQACIELAGMKFRTRETTASGFVSKSLAGETISFSQKDMSTAVRSTLDEYKAVFFV